jgi:hypothetical protein
MLLTRISLVHLPCFADVRQERVKREQTAADR